MFWLFKTGELISFDERIENEIGIVKYSLSRY